MNKIVKIAGLSIVTLLFVALPALAQDAGDEPTGDSPAVAAAPAQPVGRPLIEFSGALGAGLVCIGSAYGIGKLAASAMESMARQPEVAGNIQTGMIIAAALIEGFTFFALVVCLQQNPF